MIERRRTGEGGENPSLFRGIADGGEMAAQAVALGFGVAPDVLGEEVVYVAVGGVDLGTGDDVCVRGGSRPNKIRSGNKNDSCRRDTTLAG